MNCAQGNVYFTMKIRLKKPGGGKRHLALALLLSISIALVPKFLFAALPDGQRLREQFGTDTTAADFVFVMQRSSALTDAGVFTELRMQLLQTAEALSPIDNFILIGFDTRATSIISACPIGTNSMPCQRAILTTPPPRGRDGRLHTGLSAALQVLSRPGHAPLQFVFFIVDGNVTAAAPQPTADTLNWRTLSAEHAAWQATSIAEVYGLVVGEQAGLQISRMVFPEIRLLETSAASLRAFFERWRGDTAARKLFRQLSDEMTRGALLVQPMGPVLFHDDATSADLTLRLRSRFRRLTLSLPHRGDWQIYPDELNVAPRYEDFPLTLAPGELRTITVPISRSAAARWLGCWHQFKEDTLQTQLSYLPPLTMVDRAVLRSLGIEDPPVVLQQLPIDILWQHGQPMWRLLLVAAGLLLMVLSLIGEFRYNIAGIDLVAAFVSEHLAGWRIRLSPVLPVRLSFPRQLKDVLIGWLARPVAPAAGLVAVTLFLLWVAERYGGAVGLSVVALALLVSWGAILRGQWRRFLAHRQLATKPRAHAFSQRTIARARSSWHSLAEE